MIRPSREEAISAVAVALAIGAVLQSGVFSVGGYHLATVAAVRFACLDKFGEVVHSPEFERHATSLYTFETVERNDWTPFGAALAFVDSVGARSAVLALRRAGVKQPKPFKSVRSKPSESYVLELGRA